LPFFNPLSFYSMPLSKIVLFYELKVSLNTMVLIKLCRYQFFQLLFECLHIIFDINLEYEKNISSTVVDQYSWESGCFSILPIKNEIEREGMVV
jgi:hypothetical protein